MRLSYQRAFQTGVSPHCRFLHSQHTHDLRATHARASCLQRLSQPRGRSHRHISMALQSETAADLINTEEDFKGVMSTAQVVVVDWMAKWCRKCIYLKPKLQKMFAEEFPQVPLHFVDVNSVPGSLVTGNGIRKMPTIAVYKDGKKVSEHIASETGVGAIPKVREIVQLALL